MGDEEIPAAKSRTKRRLRTIAFGLLGAGVILTLGAAFGFLWLNLKTIIEFESAIDGINARGEPITAAECVPPPLADDENGAILLHQAAESLTAVDSGEKALLLKSYDEKWDGNILTFAEFIPKAKEYLACHDKTLELLGKALEKKRFRFDIPYEKGHSGDIDRIAELNNLSQLLEIRIWVKACSESPEESLRDIERLLNLADAAAQSMISTCLLVAFCFVAEASSALEDVFRMASLPAPELRRLGKLFLETEGKLDFKAALLADRAFSIDFFREVLRVDANPIGSGARSLKTVILKRDAIKYLSRTQLLLDSIDKPFFETGASIDETAGMHILTPLSSLLLPIQKSVLTDRFKSIARLRMTSIACFFAANRLESKARQEDLAAVAAESPPDPFTGRPFIVRIAGGSCLLISPGPDGIDQGFFPFQFLAGEPEMEIWQDDLFFYLAMKNTVPGMRQNRHH